MNEFSELPQHTQNLWFCILAYVQAEPQMINTVPVTAAPKPVRYLGAYLRRQHGLCPPEPGAHRTHGSGAHAPSDALLLTLMWKGKVTDWLQLWEKPSWKTPGAQFSD